MPANLRRLLSSHDFFTQAINDRTASMGEDHLKSLKLERDRIFERIITYASNHPEITIAQVNYLLSELVELSADRHQAMRLEGACRDAMSRLAEPRLAGRHRRMHLETTIGLPLSDWERCILDSLTDRAAIVDREFRYLYCNKSNAAFQGYAQTDLIGRNAREILGEHRFETVSRAIMEECFTGRSVTRTITYRAGQRTITFSTKCEPLFENGAVVGGICIARDVTTLAVKPDVVYRSAQPWFSQ